MKKLIFAMAITGITLTSCEKDNTTVPVENPATTNTTPVLTTVLAQDSSYDGTSSTVRKFTYNANKKCIKVEYQYNNSTSFTSHDTLIYNSEGKVMAVYKYVGTTLDDSAICTYAGGMLSQITSSTDAIYIEYNGNNLSKAIYHFVDPSLGYRADTISSMVYENNNIKNYLADGVSLTVTTDLTASNPYYGTLTPILFMILLTKIIIRLFILPPPQAFC